MERKPSFMSEPSTDPCDMSKVRPSESFFFLHLNSKLSLSPLYLAGNQSKVALPLSRGKDLSALLITSPRRQRAGKRVTVCCGFEARVPTTLNHSNHMQLG